MRRRRRKQTTAPKIIELDLQAIEFWAKFSAYAYWGELVREYKQHPNPKPRIIWPKGQQPCLEIKRKRRRRKCTRVQSETSERVRRRRRRKTN